MPEENLTKLKDALKRVQELIFLIEKDISGVRLRSATILRHEELKKQVDSVIKTIEEDVKKVERGISPLKQYFFLRNKALNAINNLTSSLEKMIKESTSIEEIQETIRLFSKNAQEEFVVTLLQLEKLWNEEIMELMDAMKKVISIMQVTNEKIVRYKRECNIQGGVDSDIGKLLDNLFSGNYEDFDRIEKELRAKLLPET
ncbi:MAG: hypothetical protein ACTSYB_06750 [Candidatus Helarchaeota archaeon]